MYYIGAFVLLVSDLLEFKEEKYYKKPYDIWQSTFYVKEFREE